MTDQSTLLTLLLLVRMDTDRPRTLVIRQLRTWAVFVRTRTDAKKYPRPQISLNDDLA